MAPLASGMAAVGNIPFISLRYVFSRAKLGADKDDDLLQQSECQNRRRSLGVSWLTRRRHASSDRRYCHHSRYSQYGCGSRLATPLEAKATIAAARYKCPVYIRFTREKTPVMTTEETPLKSAKRKFIARERITLIGCGPLFYEALRAAEELAKDGIEAEVINNHTIKPMDKDTILKSVKENRLHCQHRRASSGRRNGLGRQRNIIAKLSRADGNNRYPRPLRRIRRARRTLGKIRLDGKKYN